MLLNRPRKRRVRRRLRRSWWARRKRLVALSRRVARLLWMVFKFGPCRCKLHGASGGRQKAVKEKLGNRKAARRKVHGESVSCGMAGGVI